MLACKRSLVQSSLKLVSSKSQNDDHVLLYFWDYYSSKLNAVFHYLVKSVAPWSLKESLPRVDIQTEDLRHITVKKKNRLGSFPGFFVGRKKCLWIKSVCVQSLIFNGQQFEPVLCLLENICVLSEATESESHTEQLKLQANIFLFHAVKCLINPHKHELC